MKIAFDYHAFTLQSYGGISRYFTDLANSFYARGECVKVFAGLHRNHYLEEIPREAVMGMHLTEYPTRTGFVFRAVNHCWSQLKQHQWAPDIVHDTYYSSLPRLYQDAPRVLTVYDCIHETFPGDFSRFDRTCEHKIKAIEMADHIICISRSTKRDLLKFYDVDESKISVVHLGIDSKRFFPSRDKVDIADREYVLYVGNRSGYKNFEGLLRAYSTSGLLKNNIEIRAFGGGAFTTSEKKVFGSLGISEEYVTQISGGDEDLRKLYQNALCFVYPSKYEGFGIPPLEAMAAGCPVVASNSSSVPEVVGEAGILFDPYELDELREAIEVAAFDERVRAKLIRAGYENVNHFSLDCVAVNTRTVYDFLV